MRTRALKFRLLAGVSVFAIAISGLQLPSYQADGLIVSSFAHAKDGDGGEGGDSDDGGEGGDSDDGGEGGDSDDGGEGGDSDDGGEDGDDDDGDDDDDDADDDDDDDDDDDNSAESEGGFSGSAEPAGPDLSRDQEANAISNGWR